MTVIFLIKGLIHGVNVSFIITGIIAIIGPVLAFFIKSKPTEKEHQKLATEKEHQKLATEKEHQKLATEM